MAYSNTDIRDGGSGCAMWFGDLIEIRQIALTGQDANSLRQKYIYIQMPTSEKGMDLYSSMLFYSYFDVQSKLRYLFPFVLLH